ncbi:MULTISPECIES: TadE/TadG family type IV pilus assembly protein [Asticcacaulis]|uniref:TadE/TadG family type IV pilus assembly protein n=1 Tax=Asticcacaulis TaxID=76890 RepID=UPI001AE5FA7D|nr:pilus assembly protein TadG-related protein [Asticcacaulis sp. BE141]MBP2161464.1 Flp pilus assembly protein TadG [Asticcacaulis solisilvae]MDR6802509.1 Flp pilus assembly protein TadG [Asticcacaulis sp. BE141]
MQGADRRGNVAMTFALSAVPVVMAVTGALEFYTISNTRSLLQEAVDTGALAGAGKLAIASYDTVGEVTTTATVTAQRNVAGAPDPGAFRFQVVVDEAAGTVTVNGTADHKSLAAITGIGDTTVKATATAEALQKTPLCVLQTSGGGIELANNSIIRAPGCLIHANGDIDVKDQGSITAERVQAAGTVTGTTYPKGNSGAMVIPDPFAGMELNPKTLCSLNVGLAVGAVPLLNDTTLPAGVHCLPVLVVGKARLHLQPGDHYFMGGLTMSQNSMLTGNDVALIFGPLNVFNFADKADIRLTARKSGPFAGFLIATTRENGKVFRIGSDNAGQLLGTIYIPNATLEVTSQGSVAEDSDWSIIVAQAVRLKNGPTLVINNNYVGSGVPVPAGVGPSNGTVLKQ